MSTKTQLLAAMAIVAVIGIAVTVIGASAGGALGAWIIALGVLTVVLAVVGAIGTMRWLRPSTRLPEHLRASVPAATWRRSPVTLQLRAKERQQT
jgi:type VI protein secretion system component VasK